MEARMTLNESWVHQGRQAHGYFGNGTSPKDDASDNAAGANDLFRPANAGQRVDCAASRLVMHVPRADRSRWNSAVSDSARANLKQAAGRFPSRRQGRRSLLTKLVLGSLVSRAWTTTIE